MQTQTKSTKRTVRIVAISDTHNEYKNLTKDMFPPADIFIHAGDITCESGTQEFQNFRQFLKTLPYKHKIVIGGNHDFGLQVKKYAKICQCFKVQKKHMVDSAAQLKKLKQVCTYLEHEYIEIQGVNIFASPYIESSYAQGFQIQTYQGQNLWAKIPKKIDVLVTHMPPFGVLDRIKNGGLQVGSKNLRNAVRKKEPKVHIFGHIHEGHGQAQIGFTRFYNVASLDHHYSPVHKPTVIDLQIG